MELGSELQPVPNTAPAEDLSILDLREDEFNKLLRGPWRQSTGQNGRRNAPRSDSSSGDFRSPPNRSHNSELEGGTHSKYSGHGSMVNTLSCVYNVL